MSLRFGFETLRVTSMTLSSDKVASMVSFGLLKSPSFGTARSPAFQFRPWSSLKIVAAAEGE